jgi:hypothetical protein
VPYGRTLGWLLREAETLRQLEAEMGPEQLAVARQMAEEMDEGQPAPPSGWINGIFWVWDD